MMSGYCICGCLTSAHDGESGCKNCTCRMWWSPTIVTANTAILGCWTGGHIVVEGNKRCQCGTMEIKS